METIENDLKIRDEKFNQFISDIITSIKKTKNQETYIELIEFIQTNWKKVIASKGNKKGYLKSQIPFSGNQKIYAIWQGMILSNNHFKFSQSTMLLNDNEKTIMLMTNDLSDGFRKINPHFHFDLDRKYLESYKVW